MKLNSTTGKALRLILDEVTIGNQLQMDLPCLLPALTRRQSVIVILKEKEARLWIFDMMWFGIHLCDVSVELRNDEFSFEELA